MPKIENPIPHTQGVSSSIGCVCSNERTDGQTDGRNKNSFGCLWGEIVVLPGDGLSWNVVVRPLYVRRAHRPTALFSSSSSSCCFGSSYFTAWGFVLRSLRQLCCFEEEEEDAEENWSTNCPPSLWALTVPFFLLWTWRVWWLATVLLALRVLYAYFVRYIFFLVLLLQIVDMHILVPIEIVNGDKFWPLVIRDIEIRCCIYSNCPPAWFRGSYAPPARPSVQLLRFISRRNLVVSDFECLLMIRSKEIRHVVFGDPWSACKTRMVDGRQH